MSATKFTPLAAEDVRPLYDDADPIHDFTHVLRVLTLAERIARAEGADLQIVRTATLLHDISRDDEDTHQAGDHAVLAAHRARRLLEENGATPDFIEAVAHAIAAHRFRNEIAPETLEARVLFDADKLDTIGAVGVARAFAYGGLMNQPLWGEVSPDYQPGGEEKHTPYHEFQYKLRHIKDRLHTPTGRAIAEQRHRYMVAFYEQMASEVMGER
jgi:uncharacterized protein